MRDLDLEGLSEDGRFLVARDVTSGETFRLTADRRLRSLLDSSSRTGSTTGQLEIRMESSLSPRDIQTRIRRGESPQSVADAAGVPVAQIEGFAGPVLAEREFMCEQARRTTIRRRHVGGAGVLLGTLVDDHVAAQGGVPEETVWDSWRREDGRWTVVVTPHAATEPATFLYDVKGRYVVPADELAHDLVGDVALPDSTDMAIADAVRGEPAAEPAGPPAEPSVEVLVDEIVDDLAGLPLDEEVLTGVSSLKAARDRRALEQLALGDAEEAAVPEVEAEVDDFEDHLEDNVAVPDTMGPRKKRHERRRVPSWDEIMFGKDD